jgi:hypothetical protein
MGTPEYHKIIDVMAESLAAVRPVEKNYGHDDANKSDMVEVVMNTVSGERIVCRVYLSTKVLQLVFNRNQFTEKKYEKFLSRFEYDLEQAFLRNIHLERDDTPSEYRLKMTQ